MKDREDYFNYVKGDKVIIKTYDEYLEEKEKESKKDLDPKQK